MGSHVREAHIPSLASKVVELFSTAEEKVVLDCTVGYGGHAERILSSEHPPALLIGVDRDPDAVEAAKKRLARFGSKVRISKQRFSQIDAVLEEAGVKEVAGVLYDLGVSSPQLDVADRGFSYRHQGPLDMRMDPESPLTAADVVNTYPPEALEAVIKRYGEERYAKRIVSEIVRRRPLRTTAQLAAAVEAAIPKRAGRDRRFGERRSRGGWEPSGAAERHPARRTFQAIRIEVNRELEELEESLSKAVDVLETPGSTSMHGGRIVCISYHSLEDRIVKRFIDAMARGCVCPPGLAVCGCGARPILKKLTKRVIKPSEEECRQNPRVRSARLRAAEKAAVNPSATTAGAAE